MSYPELMNWNPMEEEYRSNFSKFPGKNNFTTDTDPLVLYIRRIPADLMKDDLASLMRNRGRKVTDVMINKKLPPNSEYTYGFVHFASYEDALFAMQELNETPPLYLQISFAQRRESIDKDNKNNMKSISRGRGTRIDLEGSTSISQKLKVTTGGCGRRVTVGSPVKNFPPNPKPDFKYTTENIEKCKGTQLAVTTHKLNSQKTDIVVPLSHNPFYSCFHCKKEGRAACSNCKKPYCSRSCQMADWVNHKRICKQVKIAADHLIKQYNSQSDALDSSYLSESSNSDLEKYQECSDVKELVITTGQIEKVSIVNTNSPSKFWVHLIKFHEEFLKMEKKMLQEVSSFENVPYTANLKCCILYNNKVCRAKVLKEKSPNETLVFLLDYGETATVLKSALFHLRKEFREIPIQAVCCKLVDETKKEDIDWSNGDTSSFKMLISDKIYRARFLKCINDVYNVSLVNENGITLFSILTEEKNSVKCVSTESLLSVTDGIPPSVWSKLKPETKMTLVPVVVNNDSIWCYLSANGGADLNEIIDTEELLKNYSGKDITVCAEEGDFAAGFSVEYKQFYRCMILKRKCSGFCVRYIDYGNEEEIKQLSSLSEDLLKKCCYIVKCKKPTSLSLDDVQKFFCDSGAEVTVGKVSKDAAELVFNFHKQHTMICYPCFSSNESDKLFAESEISPTVVSNSSYVSHQKLIPKPPVVKNCKSKDLLLNHLYNVKVVFIKTVTEVYVQLTEDESKINELFTNLNSYCNSKTTTMHTPNIGEIVCCKFSDGVWYRGQVKEKVENKYRIFFIDYGNEDFVFLKDIQILPDKFICPKFAICVSLTGIKNEDVSKYLLSRLLEENWDMKVIAQKCPFEVMLFQMGRPLSSMIKGPVNNKRQKTSLKFQKLPTEVDVKISHEDKYIYVHQVKDVKSLEELCIRINKLSELPVPNNPVVGNVYCGLCSDSLWYRVSIEEVISSNTCKVFFLDYGNYEVICIKDLRELPDDLFELPIYSIPVMIQNRKDVTLSMEELYVAKVIGMDEDVQKIKFVIKSDHDAKLPHVSALKRQCLKDGVNEVTICWGSKGLNYCQLSSDNDHVLDMFKKLQKCSKGKSPPVLSVDDVVCAQSSDGCWYRASVISDDKTPSFEVLFFDYGNTEIVTGDCIKLLPEELLEQPIFSIPLKIENMQDINDPDFFTKPIYVEKIEVCEDNVYVVRVTLETNTVLPKISSFEREKLATNAVSRITVCVIENGIFYVQLVSNKDRLEKLASSLLKAKAFTNLMHLPEVDDVVCAKYSDDIWYRSYVLEVFSEKNLLKVFFMDYGNSDIVSLENLKILPSELCSYPVSCIPIKFSNLDIVENNLNHNSCTFDVIVTGLDGAIQIVDVPPEENKKSVPEPNVTYNPIYISSFEASTLPMKSLCKVTFKASVDDSYLVLKYDDAYRIDELISSLRETETDSISHLPCVKEMLLAKRKDNLWYRCCVENASIAEESCKVYFVDLGITEDVPKHTLHCLPDNCKSFPLFAIKIFVESEEPIILEQCCYVQVLKENPDGIYSVKVHYQHMFSSIAHKELPLNEERNVVFCHKENDKLFLQDSADIDMIVEVQNIVVKCSNLKGISYKPSVGELVCAVSQINSSWYRGCIEAVISPNEYKVFFIDYGNSEIVEGQNLQCIPSALIKYPSLCIPVKFSDEKVAENIQLEKLYNVIAKTKVCNQMQIVKLVEIENKEKVEKVDNDRNEVIVNSEECNKFTFGTCKSVPFNSGEQDIVIYSVHEDRYIFCAPYNEENMIANSELSQLLTEHCSQQGITFDKSCEPELGEMVLAKYPEDDHWYRAAVIEKFPPVFIVNFVDYGNSEQLDISLLRKMEKQFMVLDVQAHMCSLIGFSVPDENMQKVYEEIKKFTICFPAERLRADVKINDDITVNIPRITSWLVERNLVISSDGD